MTARVRVVHVGRCRAEVHNGVDKTVSGLLHHLPGAGVECELWTFTPAVSAVTESVQCGVRTFLIPWRGSAVGNLTAPPPAALRHIRARAREADVLHLHSVYVPANYWAVRSGLPVVLTPHGGLNPLVDQGRHSGAKALARLTWEGSVRRRAEVWHAVSAAEGNQFRQHSAARQVVTIPNGIEDAVLASGSPPVPADGVILYLGRLAVRHKGLDLLLDGYAQALRLVSLPPLVLAGPAEDADRQQLHRQVQRLGIGGHVTLLEAVHGVAKQELVESARLFVHTSRWDGLPFAVLEALAAGRPVLVTPETNVGTYVDGAGAGLVVEADAPAVAAGLVRASSWAHAELTDRSRRAHRLVSEEFRWSVLTARMADVYRDLSRKRAS